jgi:hypothetical protein
MHRIGTDTGAPKLAPMHRANDFPQLQKFVKDVMCTVCCLVGLVMFGESTLATLLRRKFELHKDWKLCLKHQRMRFRCYDLSINSDLHVRKARGLQSSHSLFNVQETVVFCQLP